MKESTAYQASTAGPQSVESSGIQSAPGFDQLPDTDKLRARRATPPSGLANSGFGNSAGQLYRVRAPGEHHTFHGCHQGRARPEIAGESDDRRPGYCAVATSTWSP